MSSLEIGRDPGDVGPEDIDDEEQADDVVGDIVDELSMPIP